MRRRTAHRLPNPFDESVDRYDPLDAASAGAWLARIIVGPVDRMLCRSKSYYRALHPDHVVEFNANLITETRGKIWFGDLDLTTDRDRLTRLADSLGEAVYVLREFDGRFSAARDPLLHRAALVVSPTPRDAADAAVADTDAGSPASSDRQFESSDASDGGDPRSGKVVSP